jgi:tight adherence protein G
VLTAISMVLLMWAGAAGVDVGFTVYASRQAQAMADTAAVDLARYISYIDTLSTANVQTYINTKLANVLADNGSHAQLTAYAGYYASGRFTKGGYNGTSCKPVLLPPPGVPGCNAIEVTANQAMPQVFAGGFSVVAAHSGGNASGSVSGSSIATYSPEGDFSIGSYLASFNQQQSAVLDKIMGSLGTDVNITAVGFQGLATTNITLAQLINANSTVLSASNVMTAELSAQGWLTAYTNAVASAYGTGSAAYATLSGLNFYSSASTDYRFCDMAYVNTPGAQFNCSNTSVSPQGLDATVNVLQMLTTEAELTDGSSAIDITSQLNLPPSSLGEYGTATLSFQAIQPAQYAYGPVGTSAQTSQVSATLNVNLLTLLGIPIGTLSIPLSAANGTVSLQALACANNAMTSAILSATTSALSSAVTVDGSQVAAMSITGVSAQTNTFTPSQVPPPTSNNPATVGSTSVSFSGVTGLGLTNTFVGSILSSTSVLIEAYLPVLQALGVQVAGAQVAYYATNCDAVTLTQ